MAIGKAYGFAEPLRSLGDSFIAEAERISAQHYETLTSAEKECESDGDSYTIGSEQWMVWCDAINVDDPERTPNTDICDVYAVLLSNERDASVEWHELNRANVKGACERLTRRMAHIKDYETLCHEYRLKVAALR